jgi:uncharacterized protein YukJ
VEEQSFIVRFYRFDRHQPASVIGTVQAAESGLRLNFAGMDGLWQAMIHLNIPPDTHRQEFTMTLKRYGLLVGHPTAQTLDDDNDPHIEVLLDVADVQNRAAINVRSNIAPHALLYQRISGFQHNDLTQRLDSIAPGRYEIEPRSDSTLLDLTLDYVRGGFVQHDNMKIAPFRVDGPSNDLLEYLQPLVKEAINNPGYRFYIFGELWGPETKADEYFNFTPGNGIHNIHMNQGSVGQYASTNGANQDGAVFIRHPDGSFDAIFFAFQSQCWDTDDKGNCRTPIPPDPVKPTQQSILIIAALVNPYNPEAGRESVTLLNLSDQAIDLHRWSLVDNNGRAEDLSGMQIAAGDCLRVRLTGSTMLLGNKGGRIQLLTQDKAVAHEVAYAKKDVGTEGWSLAF